MLMNTDPIAIVVNLLLLEVSLPCDPVCPSFGLSVCHNFLKRFEVTLNAPIGARLTQCQKLR